MKTGFGEEENKKGLDMLLRQQNNVKIDYVKGEKPTTKKKHRETPEKKHPRLYIQRRSRQQEHASETNTQRTARLQQLRLSQEARIANETEEQRAARLQHRTETISVKMPEFLMRQRNKGQPDCSMMLNNTGQSRSTVFLFFISQLDRRN